MRGTPVASNQGTIAVPMIFSLLQSTDGERILVDTGFASGASMTGPGFKDFVRSDEILARHGIAAEDIDTLVLTHLHFDHAGNLDAFPNARIFVQRYEYESWKKVIGRYGAGGVTKDRWVFSSLDEDNFRALDAAIAKAASSSSTATISFATASPAASPRDTHSFGIQWLEVETAAGPFALAGDVCYSYFCAERMWPPGYLQGNPWNMLRRDRSASAKWRATISRGCCPAMTSRFSIAIPPGIRTASGSPSFIWRPGHRA